MASALRINDPLDFEQHVGVLLESQGYEVHVPPANTRGYDLEIAKGRERIAVQVKNYKARANIAHVLRFTEFLELPIASRFTSGWFITSSGFGNPALTHVQADRPSNLRLGIVSGHKVEWVYNPDGNHDDESFAALEPATFSPPSRSLKYFGVFTCKGGVGKTTVAAHLAGAFALQGYDVILLDLDPDKNLRKLFVDDPNDESETASLYVPPVRRGLEGSVITVLNHEEWSEREYSDTKIVICDCSPVLSENPRELVEKFDYCIIPTTLNPLGVAKHGDVITRTFEHIRKINKKAELFAVVNAYNPNRNFAERNEVLLSVLKRHVDSYAQNDPKCRLIHPDYAAIRRSDLLQYWGYHIVEGTRPQLAFREIAGRNFPRTDFLRLAEYLEDHTNIEELRD
jgi:chromosome partitioning protein